MAFTKKTVRDIDVDGKRVLVRVDFNVPIKDGVVGDTTRIKAALPTINYLVEHNARVILMSHLGRPEGTGFQPELSLEPVAKKLAELSGLDVAFVADTYGEKAAEAVAAVEPGKVLVLENVRFDKREKKNDPEIAKKLASYGDVFVLDAFGTAHRAQGSVVGPAAYLPAVAGFLLEKEVDTLTGIFAEPERPFVAIVGGSKVSSKIGVLDHLIDSADTLIIGGGMAYTFFLAQGLSVGQSLKEEDWVERAGEMLKKAEEKGVKILLPIDNRVADHFGEDVGLPDGQMGNSEVGHLNIGAGRIVFQELSRINNAIKDGSIAKNEVFVKAMDDVKADGKTLHLMGLMSPGGVHSHMNHVEALVKMAAEHGVKTVRVHAFMDGRDVDPQSGAGYMSEFCAFLAKISEETGCDARVATVSGRYWAMDRDNRWERIQRAYDVMVNASDADTDPVAGIKAYYEKDPRGDEFVEPFAAHNEGIHEGDAAIFFNFRPDRARQMTRVFTDKEFDGFEREQIKLSHFVTMTEYDPTFDVEVAFPKTFPENVLADVIAANGLKQLHTAETEKYAHVTFFLNGGIEEPKEGEERVLVASPKVATYDLQPEMSAPEVTEKLVAAINEDRADFYIVNFANCDMVGHTGVFDAAVKAVEAVDDALSKVVPAILAKGGFALITADHGNADHMFDVASDGSKHPFTAHTTNRVPFIIVDEKAKLTGIEDGRLSDIAPTMLTMAGIEPSAEMTGRVLATEA